MNVEHLDRLFHPQSVAVVGASEREGSVGRGVLTNLLAGGFSGPVFPVNSRRDTVLGIKAYCSVSTLPMVVDMAVICTPANTLPALVCECGKAGIGGLVILSAGFRETGPQGAMLEEELLLKAKPFPGMRMIGPNSLGVIVPGSKLNASFATTMPRPGSVAFISQSGALCSSVLDWSLQERIGFSYFVSTGNMADVTFADIMDYCALKEGTKSMVAYIESIRDGQRFMAAAKAFTRNKPIVAYKAGRFPQSAQAAATHTGAMAGDDDVYDAALKRAGIERVYEINDLFDCAELLADQRFPRGARLAIVTNAGGPGVMATDALLAMGGCLAKLSESTLAALNEVLPSTWSHANPVDLIGDAPPARYANAMRPVVMDEGVDALLVILTPQAMTEPTHVAHALAALHSETAKPILAAWMGGPAVAPGIRVLSDSGIPAYRSPDEAVRAFMHLISYARNVQALNGTSHHITPLAMDPTSRRKQCTTILRNATGQTSGSPARTLLELYGIPAVRSRDAGTADEAIAAARDLSGPVAIKVRSPQISHKTDVGGVALNVIGDAQVRAVFDRIVGSARQLRPDAVILGVTVEPMITRKDALELIIGIKRDVTFGPIVMVGAGGVAAEVLRDRAMDLPPLNENQARRMLKTLKIWPLLNGYRGTQAMDIEKLIELLMRFSQLAIECPAIREFDVNPLLVGPNEIIALDARVTFDTPVPES